MEEGSDEVAVKLARLRARLTGAGLSAVRLRGVDWFAWATGGGSSVVNLTAEAGVAEVLVTPTEAWVLTDPIEAGRLSDEEVPADFQVHADPWAAPEERERFVAGVVAGGRVASDRPRGAEEPLPTALRAGRLHLGGAEIARYRVLGREAAEAVTDTLLAARPEWSEHGLAGAAAEALWRRGIHPTVVLAAGEARLPRHRHPIPTAAPLGRVAMLVVCGRRHGLYANLTRFVAFAPLSEAERTLHGRVAEVEAAMFAASRPGVPLEAAYDAAVAAYARLGHAGEHLRHHQGGPTGYLAREIVVTPKTYDPVVPGMVLAWNPSLPGVKIEDTVLVTPTGLDVLTVDPRWPTGEVHGGARPTVLERGGARGARASNG
jgi:Xaa-Pro aminopeptidase